MRGRLGGAYLLYYGYVGASLGFLAPYLRGLGFSGSAIGRVTMAAQLVAGPAALAWAHLGDCRGAREPVLRTCAVGALLSICWLPAAHTPLTVGAVLVAYSLFGAAIVPLLDSLTMEWARGAAHRSYARTRLFGSLGFVVVAQGVGAALTARGDRAADPLMPLVAVACVAGYALLLNLHRPVPSSSAIHATSAPPPSAVRRMLALLRNPGVLSLFALCALHWAACGPYHLLFGVLVRDNGLPSAVTGAGMAVGVLAELAAFWAFPVLLRRFDLPDLLAFACVHRLFAGGWYPARTARPRWCCCSSSTRRRSVCGGPARSRRWAASCQSRLVPPAKRSFPRWSSAPATRSATACRARPISASAPRRRSSASPAQPSCARFPSAFWPAVTSQGRPAREPPPIKVAHRQAVPSFPSSAPFGAEERHAELLEQQARASVREDQVERAASRAQRGHRQAHRGRYGEQDPPPQG